MKRNWHTGVTALLLVIVVVLAMKVLMLDAELGAMMARLSSLDAEVSQLRNAR